jgi:hypothetical protein
MGVAAMTEKKYCCKFCNGELVLKINRHKKAHADRIGNIVLDDPVVVVDTPYYECSACGFTYTTKEIEGKWREDKVVEP